MGEAYQNFLSRLENAKGDFQWEIKDEGYCKDAIRGKKNEKFYCPLEAIYVKEYGEDDHPFKTLKVLDNFLLTGEIMWAADGLKTKIREDMLKVLGLQK